MASRKAGAYMGRRNMGAHHVVRTDTEDRMDDFEIFLEDLKDILGNRESYKELMGNAEEALERIEESIQVKVGKYKEMAKTSDDLAALYYQVVSQLDMPELSDLATNVLKQIAKWCPTAENSAEKFDRLSIFE